MICLICRQAEILAGFTSVLFQRGKFKLVVNSVPARICPGCGEADVDEETALQLLRDAEQLFQTGIRADVIEYDEQRQNQRFQR